MNTVRVWGGGIYESEEFYNLCDDLGLIVWQDFMFECSLYPGDNDFLESVKKEAEYQIIRLRNHPSIALWCGNNEIAVAWHNWGWKEKYPENVFTKDYKNLFHELKYDLQGNLKNDFILNSSPYNFYAMLPILLWS